MKKKGYHWLIIEYNYDYAQPWVYMSKKHRRYIKKMTRLLNKNSSKEQYVLVKAKGEEDGK